MPTRRNTDKPVRPSTPREGYPQAGRGRDRIKRQSKQWEEIENVASLPSLPDEDYPEGTFVFNESNNEVYLQSEGSWISSSSYVLSSIDEAVSQSGSTGSLDLTIKDPNTLVTAVEFQKKLGAGSYGSWLSSWDRSSGTPGTSFTLTRGEDVGLVEKHNSGLKWRVQFTNADGATETRSGTVEFDVDDIAAVSALSLAVDPDDGSLTAEVAGDDDTVKIYLTQTTDGSEPTDPTSSNADETVNARSGSVTFSGVTVAQGAVARVKARGENASGQLAPASTIKADRAKRTSERSSVNLLEADAGPEHSGTAIAYHEYFTDVSVDGGVAKDIDDLPVSPGDVLSAAADQRSATGADSLRFQVAFYDAGGTSGERDLISAVDTGVQSGSSYFRHAVEDITIPPNTQYIRVTALNNTTTEESFVRRAMLNRGPIAAPYSEPPSTGDLIGSHTVDVDSAGNVLVSGRRRADVQTVYFTVGVGSVPSDPTASTNDHSVTAETWEESDTGVNATPIQQVFVKARAELASGSLGEVESATAVAGPFAGDDLPRLPGETTIDLFLQRLTPAGNAENTFGREDTGGTPRTFAKHPQRKEQLSDDESISFGPFDAAPDWSRRAGGYSYRPDDGSWSGTFDPNSAQSRQFKLEDVTPTSATARAQLQQIGSPTDRSAEYSTAQMESLNDTQDSPALPNLPALNDQFTTTFYYEFHFDNANPPTPGSGSWQATVKVFSVDGAVGTATERVSDVWTGSGTGGGTATGHRSNTFNASDIKDASEDFVRLKWTQFVITSGDIVTDQANSFVDGNDSGLARDTASGVEWQTASLITAPMTDSSNKVAFSLTDPG